MIGIDATASLRIWGVEVELAGCRYEIPPAPASEWLPVLGGAYHQIVPAMVRDDGTPLLADLILDGHVTSEQCHRAARDAIEAVTGMRWWTAVRLSQWMHAHWGSLGTAVLQRCPDLSAVPVGVVLALAYRTVQEHCKDAQERQRVDMELEKPPQSVAAKQAFDQQRAAENFRALMASGA